MSFSQTTWVSLLHERPRSQGQVLTHTSNFIYKEETQTFPSSSFWVNCSSRGNDRKVCIIKGKGKLIGSYSINKSGLRVGLAYILKTSIIDLISDFLLCSVSTIKCDGFSNVILEVGRCIRTSRPGVESQFPGLLAVGPEAGYGTSPWVSFCNKGLVIASWRCCAGWRIKNNVWLMVSASWMFAFVKGIWRILLTNLWNKN